MKSNSKVDDIKSRFQAFVANRTEDQKLRHDEHMLMASFLSEIELIQKQKNIKRNKLAEMIDISPSYLTQVFRGDKPLNFCTIAKIQKALDIRFSIHADYRNKLVNSVFNNPSSDEVDISGYYKRTGQTKYDLSELAIDINAIAKLRSSGKIDAPISTINL